MLEETWGLENFDNTEGTITDIKRKPDSNENKFEKDLEGEWIHWQT